LTYKAVFFTLFTQKGLIVGIPGNNTLPGSLD